MTRSQAVPRVLLSPVLLGIITSYQPGCCEDMRVFVYVDTSLNDMVLHCYLDDNLLGGDPFASFDPVVTAWYAQVGLSRLTKLIACMPRMRDIVVAHAVYSGNLGVLARLPVDVVRAVEIQLLDLAAVKGHLNVVKYLITDVGLNGWTKWAVGAAARHGHLGIVTYLLAYRQDGYSMHSVKGAAQNGHFDMVKPHDCFHSALEAAASHNHLAIVSYIMDLFGPGVRHSTKAMDQAAENGHLEMVQFLHERNLECSTNAMDLAAGNGHLDVVKWLHEHRQEGCTQRAMNRAARQGHLEVVQWLHENRQEGCTYLALFDAMYDKRWAVALFLAKHRDEGDLDLAMSMALRTHRAPPYVVSELKEIVKSRRR